MAGKHNINYSSVYYRVKNGIISKGKLLTLQEEKMLLDHILQCQKGKPITQDMLVDKVNEFIKVNVFNNIKLIIRYFIIRL